MKLKKAETPDMGEVADMGGAPFVADMAPAAPATGKVGTLLAFLASLVALALVGAVAAMMYLNWELIAQA